MQFAESKSGAPRPWRHKLRPCGLCACRCGSIAILLASLYLLIAGTSLLAQLLVVARGGEQLSAVVGFAAARFRIAPAVNALDGVEVYADTLVRNSLPSGITFQNLDAKIYTEDGTVWRNSDVAGGARQAASVSFTDATVTAAVTGSSLAPLGCGNTGSSDCVDGGSSPALRVSLAPAALQAWAQAAVATLTQMRLTGQGSAQAVQHDTAADIALKASVEVYPTVLRPMGVRVSAAGKLRVTGALRYAGAAAASGSSDGLWSFSQWLSQTGVAFGSPTAWGAYASVAAKLGVSSLAVRVPVDATGDLLAWAAHGGVRARTAGVSAVNDAEEEARKWSMTYALSRVDLSHLFATGNDSVPAVSAPAASSSAPVGSSNAGAHLAMMWCRTRYDLLSSADQAILMHLAALLYPMTGEAVSKQPGTTVVGPGSPLDLPGSNTATGSSSSGSSSTATAQAEQIRQQILARVSYRQQAVCDGDSSSTWMPLAGDTSTTLSMRILVGRPGSTRITADSVVSLARVAVSADAALEVLRLQGAVDGNDVASLREALAALFLGQRPSAIRPTTPAVVTRILAAFPLPSSPWLCYPSQVPIAVVADGGGSPGRLAVHPLGLLLHGLTLCITPPWLDALLGVKGTHGVWNATDDVPASAAASTGEADAGDQAQWETSRTLCTSSSGAAAVRLNSSGMSAWSVALGLQHAYAVPSLLSDGTGLRASADAQVSLSAINASYASLATAAAAADVPWAYMDVSVPGKQAGQQAPAATLKRSLSVNVAPSTSCSSADSSVNASTASNSGRRRLQSSSTIPATAAAAAGYDDANGGLLAALVNWYIGSVAIGAWEHLAVEGMPPAAVAAAAAQAAAKATTRGPASVDLCQSIFTQDLAAYGTCCGTNASAARSLSLTATARIETVTLRQVLFRTSGDVQPVILPTFLLRHPTRVSVNVSNTGDRAAGSAELPAVAAVRICIQAATTSFAGAPGTPAGASDTGGAFVPGAAFASGVDYRIRVRAVLSVLDADAFWSTLDASNISDFRIADQENTTAVPRSMMDIVLNGATLLEGEADGRAVIGSGDDASALSAMLAAAAAAAAAAGSNDAKKQTTLTWADDGISPIIPVTPTAGEPVLGNVSGLWEGAQWTVTVATHADTVSMLHDSCAAAAAVTDVNRMTALSCFPTEQQRQQLVNSEPLLYRLMSGMTVRLRLPTVADTVAFAIRGMRTWPQQASATANIAADGTHSFLQTSEPAQPLVSGMNVNVSTSSKLRVALWSLLGVADTLPVPPQGDVAGYNNISNAKRSSAVQLGRSLLPTMFDLLCGYPPTQLGTAAGEGVVIPADQLRLDYAAVAAIAVRDNVTDTALLISEWLAALQSGSCPLPLPQCTGAYGEAAAAGPAAGAGATQTQPRGINASCAYPVPRVVCDALASFLPPAGTPPGVLACVLLARTSCAEYAVSGAAISVWRSQQVPVMYIQLPDMDLGDAFASLQVATAATNTTASASASAYPWHAATLILTGTKTTPEIGWQEVRVSVSLMFMPLHTVGSATPRFASDTVSVRTAPASRQLLLAALLTRTTLLAHAVTRHRALDVKLPMRMFPSASVFASSIAAQTVTQLLAAPISLSLQVAASAADAAAAKMGTDLRLPQTTALLRPHIFALGDTLYLGMLVVNTLPVQISLRTVQGVRLSGAIASDSSYRLMQAVAGNVTFCTAPPRTGAPIVQLSAAPVDVSHSGAVPSVTAAPGAPSAAAAAVISLNVTDGCSPAVLSNNLSISLDAVAASIGLDAAWVQRGLSEGWAKHVALPLQLEQADDAAAALACAVLGTSDSARCAQWHAGFAASVLVPAERANSHVSDNPAFNSPRFLHLSAGIAEVAMGALPPALLRLLPVTDASAPLQLTPIATASVNAGNSPAACAQYDSSLPVSTPTPTSTPYAASTPTPTPAAAKPTEAAIASFPPDSYVRWEPEYVSIDLAPGTAEFATLWVLLNLAAVAFCCYDRCCGCCSSGHRRTGYGTGAAGSIIEGLESTPKDVESAQLIHSSVGSATLTLRAPAQEVQRANENEST